jgi:hypothetical protein
MTIELRVPGTLGEPIEHDDSKRNESVSSGDG